jgi:hypothetical protein
MALLLALTLVAAGCGGDDGGSSEEDTGDESSEEADGEDEPEGQVIVDDDFDDDDNVWAPDELDLDGEQDLGIEDGSLVTEWQSDAIADLEEDQSLTPNQLWPGVTDELVDDLVDVRVEAEVSFGTPGTAGLACRIADVADDADDFRAYFFQLASTGQINLAEADEEGTLDALAVQPELSDEEREEVDELPLEDTPFPFEDGETYELSLTCVDGDDGVELTAAIDGEEVLRATDDEDPIDSGAAGILAGQSRLATEVDGFDEYEIAYESFTLTNVGEEIDEDDIEAAAEAAEEGADEPDEPAEPSEPEEPAPDIEVSAVLGEPTPADAVADYGTDEDFDVLALNCFLGHFDDCDTLYRTTPVGSAYEFYGASCGGRLEVAINGDCQDAADFASQPGTIAVTSISEFGSDPMLDDLALACEAGDLEACDELYAVTAVGSEYESFGSTCGARGNAYEGNCISDQG